MSDRITKLLLYKILDLLLDQISNPLILKPVWNRDIVAALYIPSNDEQDIDFCSNNPSLTNVASWC